MHDRWPDPMSKLPPHDMQNLFTWFFGRFARTSGTKSSALSSTHTRRPQLHVPLRHGSMHTRIRADAAFLSFTISSLRARQEVAQHSDCCRVGAHSCFHQGHNHLSRPRVSQTASQSGTLNRKLGAARSRIKDAVFPLAESHHAGGRFGAISESSRFQCFPGKHRHVRVR